MGKVIDHYQYWNKVRGEDKRVLYREKVVLKLLNQIIQPKKILLDVGCGNGKFMKLLAKEFPDVKIKGVDYSKVEVAEAKKGGLDVQWGDFEKRTSIPAKSIDIAYSGEVIEHVYNPDNYLEEIHRILKDDGYLIVATPNLLAWFNRILAVFGIQPLFLEMSTRSKLFGAGILKRLKKEPQPVGHIRIFTKNALVDILEEYGFEVLTIKGGIYDEGLPRAAWWFDTLFTLRPSLSAQLIILARKKSKKKGSM